MTVSDVLISCTKFTSQYIDGLSASHHPLICAFVKPRTPPASSTAARPLDLALLKLVTFWMLQLGNIIQGFGYFLPTTYLPTYSTTTAGLSDTTGTLLIALFNAASAVGRSSWAPSATASPSPTSCFCRPSALRSPFFSSGAFAPPLPPQLPIPRPASPC